MKALILNRPGPPETLEITNVSIPEPLEGEVRVKIHAVGLNPADYKFMQHGIRTWSYPFIPGLDAAGTIDALGKNVMGWNIGDSVYYHGNFSKCGVFAQYAITTAHTISPLPENLSFIEAAALPCAGFTAYQALNQKLNLQAGQTILIHAGAGGVGGFALQLAKIKELEIITTASPVNFEWVRKLGASFVIDYNSEDVVVKVKEITRQRGVDAIIDTVSSDNATKGFEMLAFGGGIACVNGLPDFSQMQSFGKALSVHDIALGGAHISGDYKAQEMLAKIGKDFGDIVSKHKIDPMVSEIIEFEEIPHALTRLSLRKVKGKIVAKVNLMS
jgi:NADPH:quinone reductase-like Zn-dependent oxidoreductase